MNTPVPTPSKKVYKDLKMKSKSNVKLITYICTIPKNGELIQVEIKAAEKLEVGKFCYDKHGEWPIDVVKKPYKMPEHMTQRLNNHEGLKALAKKLNKKAGRK